MSWKPAAQCAPAIRGERRTEIADEIRKVAPGRTYAEIAEKVGITEHQVKVLLYQFDIPAGVPVGRPRKDRER